MILGIKAGIFIAAYLGYVLLAGVSGPYFTDSIIFRLWMQWDANWYIEVARDGYIKHPQGYLSIVFYPLYPWLIRCAHLIVHDWLFSALLVSNIFSTGALLLFYGLCRYEYDSKKALYSLLAITLFPTAYFLNAPYTEGVFLFFAIGSLFSARKGMWGMAGVLGGLATLTRLTGVCLFPALLVEYWLQRKEKKPVRLWNLAWLVFFPMAIAFYLWLNRQITGDYFGYLKEYAGFWSRRLDWPWVGVIGQIQSFPFYEPDVRLSESILENVAVVLFIAGIWKSVRTQRLTYTVFVTCMAILCISNSLLQSIPRYFLGAFPLFFVDPKFKYKVGVFAVMIFFLFGYSIMFVFGKWAF